MRTSRDGRNSMRESISSPGRGDEMQIYLITQCVMFVGISNLHRLWLPQLCSTVLIMVH